MGRELYGTVYGSRNLKGWLGLIEKSQTLWPLGFYLCPFSQLMCVKERVVKLSSINPSKPLFVAALLLSSGEKDLGMRKVLGNLNYLGIYVHVPGETEKLSIYPTIC